MKSHYSVILFYFITLTIDTGFALRCYECNTIFVTPFPGIPKCTDGLGIEIECAGSCVKTIKNYETKENLLNSRPSGKDTTNFCELQIS